jgi:hypothetical protein
VVIDLTLDDIPPNVQSGRIRDGNDMLADLRRLIQASSATWASGRWRFNVRGTQCNCTLSTQDLAVAEVHANPASLPGNQLYGNFAAAHTRASDKRVLLGFHGTPPENLESICSLGLDPARRGANGQAMGRGEYFATRAQTSMAYCRLDPRASRWSVLLFALLEDAAGLSARTEDVVVVHRPDHQLPLCVVSFAVQR